MTLHLDVGGIDWPTLWPPPGPGPHHYLRHHPDVDPERIGQWGQSQGAEATPEVQIQAALDCARTIQAASRRGLSYAHVETRVLAPARREPWGRYFTPPPLPDAATWEYWRARGGLPDQELDRVALWEQVHCPVLAVCVRVTVMPPSGYLPAPGTVSSWWARARLHPGTWSCWLPGRASGWVASSRAASAPAAVATDSVAQRRLSMMRR